MNSKKLYCYEDHLTAKATSDGSATSTTNQGSKTRTARNMTLKAKQTCKQTAFKDSQWTYLTNTQIAKMHEKNKEIAKRFGIHHSSLDK